MNWDLNPVNWFLVFARAGAFMLVFPLFSAENIPVRLRIALAGLVALLAAPFLPAPVPANPGFWGLLRMLFVEVSVGLLLGFVSRWVFFTIDLAGGIISTEIGLMLSASFSPLTSSAVPVPGTVLFWLTMMLLLSLNLHHWIIAAFQQSYTLVPAGAAHLSEGLGLEVLRGTAQIFVIALQISAPVMAVSFVITLVFSILSRAVPQMNAFMESFPVRSMAGLGVFGLTCHLMAQHIENCLHRLPQDLLSIARLLGA